MPETILTGVVIKIIDFQDTDQVVTLLTRDEVISFIAKGVRKLESKNRLSLQLGNTIEAEIFRARLNGKLSKLKRATLINQVPINVDDTASVLLEILKVISRIDNTSINVFTGVVTGFAQLGEGYNHHVKTFVIAKALESFGIKPNYLSCVQCGRNDMIDDFQFYAGGFLCKHHRTKSRDLSELKAFKLLNTSLKRYKEISPLLNKMIFQELKKNIDNNS